MCNTNRCSFGLQPLLNELIHEVREIWIGASDISGDWTSFLDHLLFADWWQPKKIVVKIHPHSHKENDEKMQKCMIGTQRKTNKYDKDIYTTETGERKKTKQNLSCW